jgi:hypothetical protein
MKNGVYDIPIEQYHSCQGFSRSTLVHFNKSPLHFWHQALSGKAEKPKPVDVIKKANPLEFGNALHSYVLERNEFFNRYIALPKINRVTKAGKAAYEDLLIRAEGKQIICEDALKEIESMNLSIESNSDAKALISDAEYEKSLFWTDPDTGILCKVRPDIWHNNFICDLKTAQCGALKDFQKSVFAYSYHIQAGMIQEALKHVLGVEMDNFIFVAIEKEAPYAVGVYRLDPMAVSLGVTQFKNILQGIKQCQESNNWPSYPTEWINVPKWMQD